MNKNYVVVWEYVVRTGLEREFEGAYAADGIWGKFFAASTDYIGTELLRDRSTARYWTIDRWTSGHARRQFIDEHRTEYDRIDGDCAHLTQAEIELGEFDAID
jgi:hypothetical protein